MEANELSKNCEEQDPLLQVVTQPKSQQIMKPTKDKAKVSDAINTFWLVVFVAMVTIMAIYTFIFSVTRRQSLITRFIYDKYGHRQSFMNNHMSNVFYYKLVTSDKGYNFADYTNYLGEMANTYPNLKLNVHFLIDDRREKPITGFNPFSINRIDRHHLKQESVDTPNDQNANQISCFMRKFNNVNITSVRLSKFMAGTPMIYKWRIYHSSVIPFYCIVLSVWRYGGIGMDLDVFNKIHLSQINLDGNFVKILNDHNKGLSVNPSILTAKRSEKDVLSEDSNNNYLPILFSVMQWFSTGSNETSNTDKISNNISPFSNVKPHEPLVRTKRSVIVDNITPAKINTTIPVEDKIKNNKSFILSNETSPIHHEVDAKNKLNMSLTGNDTFSQYAIFFHVAMTQLSPFTEDSKPVNQKDNKHESKNGALIVETEGKFLTSDTIYHPFLTSIINSWGREISPRFIIEDKILYGCRSIYHPNICENVYFYLMHDPNV